MRMIVLVCSVVLLAAAVGVIATSQEGSESMTDTTATGPDGLPIIF
jgi:hypothetical protein